MSEDKKDDNVRSLTDRRVDKLTVNGNMYGLMERFELLRLKFMYKDEMTQQEGIEFITLVKYFYKYGTTEGMRYSCKQIIDTYLTPNGL